MARANQLEQLQIIFMIDFRKITFLLFTITPLLGASQKFTLFGTDSVMAHEKGNVHYSTILEHYFSENLHHFWNDKPISITQFGAQIDKYIFDRIALGGAGHVTVTRGNRIVDNTSLSANTVGLGLAGSLRIELLNLSHHNFYIESQQGMVFTIDSFPPGGTPWNFIVKYGLGYTVHLSNKRYLNFGWRWMHISNGTGFVPTNPAYDGNGIYIGFKFAK